MQNHELFDKAPKGNFKSFEEFYLTEKRGSWIANQFIDKEIYEYDSLGRLIAQKSINPLNNEINSESFYKYKNDLIESIIQKTKWGSSTTNNFYDEFKRLTKKYIKNSSGDNHSHRYEYDDLNRLTKTISEFRNRKDIYLFEFSIDCEIEIKTTKLNDVVISTEYFKNGLKIKLRNKDNEYIEFKYNPDGLLLSEKKVDITRTFNYYKNGFPSSYYSFISESDYNKEFYEYDFDEYGNWIEIRCFKENENFPKHLKTIKKRKINYT